MTERRPDWINIVFITTAHGLAVAAVVYMATVRFSWWTVALALVWFGLCGMSITGGYHRLFAHRAYRATGILRALYLVFGAASVQNSALKWSADHRVHHAHTDREGDPYNIRRGFWWAHIGWIFWKDVAEPDAPAPQDLVADPLVRLQHRHYLALVLLVGAALPMGLATLWGDPLGALLVAGFLRLVVQWHATFAINSFAHLLGTQPYSTKNTARDSAVTAFLTLGEGYHNFHHRFQSDYRNGIRWYQFDPTKWFVWSLARLGITRDLRRTPDHVVRRAREEALGQERASRHVGA